MSSLKIKPFTLFIMLAFLFLWLNTGSLADRLSGENVSLRYSKGTSEAVSGLSQKHLDELPKDKAELPKIMLWNQSDNIMVTTQGNSSARPSVIDITGANLLSMDMLDGAPLSINDKSGCTVDKETAYSLFGTSDVVGKTIYIENIPYVIRGVFKENQPLVIKNSADKTDSFLNAELLFSDTYNAREDAEKFISSKNLPRPDIIIDETLVAMLSKLIMFLPGVVLIISMLIKVPIRAVRVRNQTLLFLTCVVFMFISAVVLVFILKLPTTIPLRFIPSRWSDFSFWNSQFNIIATNVKEVLAFQKTFMESRTIQTAATLVLSFAGTLFTLILLIERIKIQKTGELFIFSFAGVAAVFAFCVMQKSGFGFNIQAVYLVLPCCFLIDLIINSFDKWLINQPKEETLKCS